MNEIDDIKRRAGITEGSADNKVESIAEAHISGADGYELVDSIMQMSGGDAKTAIVITSKVIGSLVNYPGAITSFIEKIQEANKSSTPIRQNNKSRGFF
jgi:hypothetical protein